MARPGVAIVTDHAVSNEILGAGRDVIEPHGAAQRLDRNDSEPGRALHSLPRDISLAGDCRIDVVKETQMVAQTSSNTNDVDGFGQLTMYMFDDEPKAERP